jgi:hypothetical protein
MLGKLQLVPIMLALVLSCTITAVGQNPGSACTRHDAFPQSCNPFGSQATVHPIDSLCGVSGDADTTAGQAQDAVKNNLCATGSAHVLTITMLKTLQQAVDGTGLKYGNPHGNPPLPGPPEQRPPFFQMPEPEGFREGDLVSFVGYIVDTKEGDPETVNCHCNGQEFNDVHVTLADHALHLKSIPAGSSPATRKRIEASNDSKLCTAAYTAEVVPHRRPDSMQKTGLDKLKDKKIVKITGQLFFDASHLPCQDGKRGQADPARLTSWEIHPVYEIQICKNKTLANCRIDQSSDWLGL